jgi:TRAP transporter TAXI family solute receptor
MTTIPPSEHPHKKIHRGPFNVKTIMEMFDIGPGAAAVVLMIVGLVASAGIIYFIQSAPPTTITMTSGPAGSSYQKQALRYAALLKKSGVTVKVLTSEGSMQNLQRLEDPKSHVQVGMVQGGLVIEGTDTVPNPSADIANDKLMSLGSISHQPLLIFYRGKGLNLLSELKNKKVSIGPEGSGTNQLATAVLAANGIKPGEGTTLLTLEAHDAAEALKKHTIEAAFIMSESASTDILKALLREADVKLYSFTQANAYTRRLNYLDALNLPKGAIDLGAGIPKEDIALVGPMVELIAVKSLHPALSDLLLEAATQIHGRPGIFQQRSEFPAPIEHTIRLSEDALRYYKSGKSFAYRYFPFWLASLLSRILLVFIPSLVILIPVLKLVPAFFRWRVQTRIYQRYRELLSLERVYVAEKDPARQAELRKNFDRIEDKVNRMKVKSRYADQIYGLRGHIDYVRGLVGRHTGAEPS